MTDPRIIAVVSLRVGAIAVAEDGRSWFIAEPWDSYTGRTRKEEWVEQGQIPLTPKR